MPADRPHQATVEPSGISATLAPQSHMPPRVQQVPPEPVRQLAGEELRDAPGEAVDADDLALLGVARALGGKRHLVVSAIGEVGLCGTCMDARGLGDHDIVESAKRSTLKEHPAVMAPARYLAEQGWSLTVVPVNEYGQVSTEDVANALRPDAAIVSVMHANNEVGTVQPIEAFAAVMKPRGILLHTGAAQSAGKMAVDVSIPWAPTC